MNIIFKNTTKYTQEKYAEFLKQKQIDMYIKNTIFTKYGTKYEVF